MADEPDDQESIRSAIRRVNGAFLSGDPGTIENVLGEVFHKDMVIRGPNFELMAEGKPACIKSYVDFAAAARIISSEFSDVQVDLYGDMATATYAWKMAYAMNSEEYADEGNDVFMFVLEDGKWLAAWRAMSQTG